MGLNIKNAPYFEWEQFRSENIINSTQNTLYTKQVLNQNTYIKTSYRVDNGRDFDLRRYTSSLKKQDSHCYGPEKMFGHQEWTKKSVQYLNSGLYIEYLGPDIPGNCEQDSEKGCFKCQD